MAEPLTLQTTVLLSDGHRIPQLGLGVYLSRGKSGVEAVQRALSVGLRAIDTAVWYGNEDSVGEGVRSFISEPSKNTQGIKREDVYITSKIWDDQHEEALKAVQQSVAKLGSYIDLMLIHSPNPGKDARLKAWSGLIEARKQGLVKSIGVSNYGVHHLEELVQAFPNDPPVINQIELSPFFQRKNIVSSDVVKRYRIAIEAYSPLGKGEFIGASEIHAVARKLSKTPAQILIRWSLQKGYIVIPKGTGKHIDENAQVFDFELSPDDMRFLDTLETGEGVTWNPTLAP